ncbi:MAG: ROK family protein, partial [Pisciglobus halotolerans]|nr:ROK family protein [Pisciglobus halotolerans]
LTLGTGVGGGIIVDHKLVHGNDGAAGEIGHVTVEPDGYLCTCGKKGCLETVASATGVVHLARDFAETYAGDSTLKYNIDDGQLITAKDVYELAKENDELAVAVTEKVGYYLGLACSHLANILDPSTIVLGGGVSKAGDILLETVRPNFEKFTFPTIRNKVDIRLAELGNDAGVIGAASLVHAEIVTEEK